MSSSRPGLSRTRRTVVLVLTAGIALSACGTEETKPRSAPDSRDWSAVLSEARGQRVNWYMYGGDETLNRFVAGPLTQRLKRYGVTVNQVKITDTAEAVNKVLGEKQAGRDKGSVDLIWVNGENFATGKQAKLWRCGYDRNLPNAKYVDFTDPAVASDFGVPVEGCESVWQQANSALVYDSSALTAGDVASVDSLFAWARTNPGRFTYAAPPDFTGSMAVRTFLYDTAGGPDKVGDSVDDSDFALANDRLWRRLNDIEPALWRRGNTYPATQEQVESLYASGEISAFLTYGPGAVGQKVANGTFPASTREAVLDVGNIANNSFVAVPANAAHAAAAMVIANELLDPAVQLTLFTANGAYPAIDPAKLSPEQRAAFDAVELGPAVLPLTELTASTQPELPAAYISRIEAGWKTHVLQQ